MFHLLVLCLQGRPFDFEDGDVYMSSHEHRFRMFSSVEYEGQLYMTPQNFIESVTMSEPRSTSHSFYTCLLGLRHWDDWALCRTYQKTSEDCYFLGNYILHQAISTGYPLDVQLFFITLVPFWPDVVVMWFISELHLSSNWLYAQVTL